MPILPVTNEGYPGVNPTNCGWGDCPPGGKNGPSARTSWILHYVVSGCGVFEIGGKRYDIKPGTMFVIPPHVTNTYQADREDPWYYIWVGFTYPGELPVKLPDVVECPGAGRIFQAMKQAQKQESGRSAYLCSCVWELFAYFQEKERRKTDAIDQALSMMQSSYADGITVEQIADRLGIDRSYFSTRFKRRVGVSPQVYLMDLRMKVAATLLSGGTGVSVTATSVGYADIYTFSKMFKRHYGISPSQYAKLPR